MIRELNKFKSQYALPGSFAANAVTLMTGTTIGQLILIGVSPFLTRIYTPKDFGIFTLYASIASMLAIVAGGRYELAIMLPEKDDDAVNIVTSVIFIGFFMSVIIFMGLCLFNPFITALLGNSGISFWLFLVPLMVFSTVTYQAFYFWLNRKKQYGKLAANKVTQAILTVGINLIMGLAGFGVSGLIIGAIAGQFIASLILGWRVFRENKKMIHLIAPVRIKQLLARYRNFPIYSLPADFINVASAQTPAVLLTGFFGPAVVGFFGLTQRVLTIPISFISTSILDVFKERASRDYREKGNCSRIYIKTFKSLFLLSIVPFAILFLTAPKLFSLVFGKEWEVAGEYARILSPMFFLRFTCSSLSYVLYIAGKQNYDLVWQIFLFILTVCSIAIGVAWHSVKVSLVSFSLSYSMMYLVYLWLSYHFAKGKRK